MRRGKRSFKPRTHVNRAVVYNYVLKKYIDEHGGGIAACKDINIRVNLFKASAGERLGPTTMLVDSSNLAYSLEKDNISLIEQSTSIL